MSSVGRDVGRRALPEPTVEPDDAKVEFSDGISANPRGSDLLIGSNRMSGLSEEIEEEIRIANLLFNNFCEEGTQSQEEMPQGEECDWGEGDNVFLAVSSDNIAGTRIEGSLPGCKTDLERDYLNLSDDFHLENRDRIRVYSFENQIGRYRMNGGVHKCFTTMSNFVMERGALICCFDQPYCGQPINICLDCQRIISRRDRRCKACRSYR
jgi:hypothetical protein